MKRKRAVMWAVVVTNLNRKVPVLLSRTFASTKAEALRRCEHDPAEFKVKAVKIRIEFNL